jgi:hypothetical protein
VIPLSRATQPCVVEASASLRVAPRREGLKPVFTSATPQWREGDTFLSRPGRVFRILAINDSSDDFHAVWTVELE